MKRFFRGLIAIICVVIMVFAAHTDKMSKLSGTENSISGHISAKTEEFIIKEFGSAKSPAQLMAMVSAFSMKNFVYDGRVVGVLQVIDVNKFVFEQNFHGVCLDFSVFTKTVFSVICEHNNFEKVACYTVLGQTPFSEGHAVNYIAFPLTEDLTAVYFLDLTDVVAAAKAGKAPKHIEGEIVEKDKVQGHIKAHFEEKFDYTFTILD